MPDEKRVEELQHKSIALTGKFLQDLNSAEAKELCNRLADADRWDLFESFFVALIERGISERESPRSPSSSIHANDKLFVLTQAQLRAAINGNALVQDDIRQALLDGAAVEPGPVLAYLVRRTCTSAHGRWTGISLRFRDRGQNWKPRGVKRG